VSEKKNGRPQFDIDLGCEWVRWKRRNHQVIVHVSWDCRSKFSIPRNSVSPVRRVMEAINPFIQLHIPEHVYSLTTPRICLLPDLPTKDP
jgi:hypothetical protein